MKHFNKNSYHVSFGIHVGIHRSTNSSQEFRFLLFSTEPRWFFVFNLQQLFRRARQRLASLYEQMSFSRFFSRLIRNSPTFWGQGEQQKYENFPHDPLHVSVRMRLRLVRNGQPHVIIRHSLPSRHRACYDDNAKQSLILVKQYDWWRAFTTDNFRVSCHWHTDMARHEQPLSTETQLISYYPGVIFGFTQHQNWFSESVGDLQDYWKVIGPIRPLKNIANKIPLLRARSKVF